MQFFGCDARDLELSFSGPALGPVIQQWEARLDRLILPREYLGPQYEDFCQDFLNGLRSDRYNSVGAIKYAFARKPFAKPESSKIDEILNLLLHTRASVALPASRGIDRRL